MGLDFVEVILFRFGKYDRLDGFNLGIFQVCRIGSSVFSLGLFIILDYFKYMLLFKCVILSQVKLVNLSLGQN